MTREDVYAWLDKQVDALKVMREPLGFGDVENIAINKNELHIYNFQKILDILGCPFVREYHTDTTDALYFEYRGVKFFGLSWEKRIGKKAS